MRVPLSSDIQSLAHLSRLVSGVTQPPMDTCRQPISHNLYHKRSIHRTRLCCSCRTLLLPLWIHAPLKAGSPSCHPVYRPLAMPLLTMRLYDSGRRGATGRVRLAVAFLLHRVIGWKMASGDSLVLPLRGRCLRQQFVSRGLSPNLLYTSACTLCSRGNSHNLWICDFLLHLAVRTFSYTTAHFCRTW